jgi:hypothetical protein
MKSLWWAIPLGIFLWIASAIGISKCANAGEWELHQVALHYGPGASYYNGTTPGIGYAQDGWGYGVYHNSLEESTVYVARQFPVNRYFGYEAGLATGYEKLYGLPIQPIAAMYIRTEHLKIRIIPGEATAVGFSLTWRH